MKTVTVLHNQSIQDVAIQATGNIDSLTAICDYNNVSVTQLLEIGMIIMIPDSTVNDVEISNYYTRKTILPASGKSIQDGTLLFENGLFQNGLFQ